WASPGYWAGGPAWAAPSAAPRLMMKNKRTNTPSGSRRSFLTWLIVAAAGLIGISLAVPLAGYVASPALKRRELRWVDAGPMDDLPIGEPTQRDLVMTITDGYMEVAAVKGIWALRLATNEVTVYRSEERRVGKEWRWAGDAWT